MRKSGPRGSRAKRRHQPRLEPPEAPAGWPDPELLKDRLAINDLAHRFLEEMRPETVRTVLKRMETPTRKAVFERHSIPVTKVGLRSAAQVLALLRSEESPAESPILATMLDPASDLFHYSSIGSSEATGLRLKLVDLALSLLIGNDSVINGLRTWHKWAQPEFEDLTLAVVIGLKCSHAVVAAAYLAGSHADVAENYETLRQEYPRMPEVLPGTLTATNPLTRYLAARPDRKLPQTAAELRVMVAEDSRVRETEINQTRREGGITPFRLGFAPEPPVDTAPPEADPESSAGEPERPEPAEGTEPEQTAEPHGTAHGATPPEPEAPEPALPGVADWAAAVSAAKRITERLVMGHPPTSQDLRPLQLIHDQVTQLADLLGHIVGEPVEPSRSGIDTTLTLILSDPQMSERLNGVPATRAEVRERLDRFRADRGSAPGEPQHATQPKPHATEPDDRETADRDDLDLADLDTMLRGELGNRLNALSGAPDTTGPMSPENEPENGTDSATTVAAPVPPESEGPTAAGEKLLTVGMQIRTPQGELAQRFHQLATELVDSGGPADMLLLRCASLPVSLVDPAAGGVPFLTDPIEELSACPSVLAFRESMAELCRQGVRPHDPVMVRMAMLAADLEQTALSAAELLEAAETRTLKYDKATKVYRHWMSPEGTLRPLIDALRRAAPITVINELADECRKLGASRAVDETAAVLIDANRTKIVAGARKTLTDKFGEVVGLADTATAIAAQIDEIRQQDRSAAWRFDVLNRFRSQAHTLMPRIEKELSRLDGVPDGVASLVLRSLSLAVAPDPIYGPEPSLPVETTGDRR